ncbi:MAG: T9SS type A sorting domain-containing protein [candidate division WOR-3 bacterium]|nr:T9SS type A sorting domain-containing protein [candidate division WOR-3 bacterium]
MEVGVVEGNIIPYKCLSLPISCFDKEGNRRPDILELIKERDNKVFLGDSGDSLMIEFPQRGEMIALSVEEKEEPGGLSVSGNNMEALYMSPRENFSTQLLYLPVDTSPLANGVTDSLTLTLKWNSYHPLDYISLVKRIDNPLTYLFIVKPCSLATAIHSKNGEVEQKLLVSDQDYEELLPGDTIRFEFTVPPKLEPEWVRDFVFVSNGYYITDGDGGSQSAYSNIPLVPSLSLYPNPTRNDMVIRFGIPREEKVSLKVYDVSGREVKMLVDDKVEAGYHTVRFDGKGFPSGIYFARLVTNNYEATKKLVLMR